MSTLVGDFLYPPPKWDYWLVHTPWFFNLDILSTQYAGQTGKNIFKGHWEKKGIINKPINRHVLI